MEIDCVDPDAGGARNGIIGRYGPGFGSWGFGFGVSDLGLRVEGCRYRFSSGFRVPGSRIRVPDFGFQIAVSGITCKLVPHS